MITVTIGSNGRFGNQMFQYAFARSLSLKTNTEFKIDLSFLKRRDLGENFTYRDFDLNIFKKYKKIYIFNIINKYF